jgi:hypothetical protein
VGLSLIADIFLGYTEHGGVVAVEKHRGIKAQDIISDIIKQVFYYGRW